MDKYLLEILKQVNTIIIPGLGALTITDPDSGEIMFMPYLKHDDGKLSAHIAEKEGWDENEAKNLIAKYVREIQADLDQGEEYTMYQFGSFYKEDGEIHFKNWDRNAAKVENEYIPPVAPEQKEEPTKENPKVVQLKDEPADEIKEQPKKETVPPIVPVSKSKEENQVAEKKELNILEKEEQEATAAKLATLKEIQENKDKKKKKGAGFWVGIAMLVVLLIGGTYVGLNYDTVKQHLPFLADNSSTESEETQDETPSELEVSDESSESITENDVEENQTNEIVTEEDIATDEIIAEESEEIVEETVTENPVMEEAVTETTSYSSELPYQIIAGAFSEEANANRLVEKLKSEGYPALQKQKGSRFMVSVKSFATRADAQSELSAIKEVAPGGWITQW